MILWKTGWNECQCHYILTWHTIIFSLRTLYFVNLSKWIGRTFPNPNPGSRTKIIFFRVYEYESLETSFISEPKYLTKSTKHMRKVKMIWSVLGSSLHSQGVQIWEVGPLHTYYRIYVHSTGYCTQNIVHSSGYYTAQDIVYSTVYSSQVIVHSTGYSTQM